MAHYPDVKPGDPFKPSARLSNQVRHFFNGVQTVSAGKNIKSAFANNNRVAVINSTEKTLPAYTAIYVSNHNTTSDKNGLIDLNLLVEPATSDQLLWGVTENDIEPDEIGMMIVSGITQAYITGSGNYATPGANGKLVAGASGKALILHPGDSETPGIVQLGYSGGGVSVKDDYTGAFKLRHIEGRTFELCHGVYINNPNHTYHNSAGFTDLPGAKTIPKQNIILPEGKYSADIYLNACSNDGIYSVSIAFDSYSAGRFDFIYIGSIRSDGTVIQNYKPAESTIYFGRQWYL